MFDVGFSEILVIAVVALIVIGPERLPKVARTLGHLFGRMQRYVNDVKADIQREMEIEELKKLQSSVEDAARSIEQSVSKEVHDTEQQLNALAEPFAEPAAPSAAPATPPADDAQPPRAADAAAPEAAAGEPSPQLELGLDSPQKPALEKQA